VGPTAEGEFPEPINDRLARMGEWMKVNGESIYRTSRSPFRTLSFDGRVTAKGNTLYLHVFSWPEAGLELTGLETRVLTARALDGGEALTVNAVTAKDPHQPPTLVISKPKKIHPAATVVQLRLAGPPAVAQPEPMARPEADGSFVLRASDSEIHGRTALYEVSGLTDYIGSWQDSDDYVTWNLEVPPSGAGRYRVELNYSCQPETAGSRFTVGFEGGAKLTGTVNSTASWDVFRSDPLGEIRLPQGKQTLVVRTTEISRETAMNLHEIRLTPVR